MKNSTLHTFVFLLTFFSQISVAQEIEYSSLIIPKELKENANAVVRNDHTEITVDAIDVMYIKVSRVVTVLNKLGDQKVGAVVGYDNNSNITDLSAKIYDALGNEIKKINKSKFVDVSAVDGGTLYSDSRLKYLDYTPISYPYTVHLEYEVKTSSTGFLPNWNPVEGYLVSTQKSTYLLNLKDGKARIKELNFEGYAIEKSISSSKIYFEATNISATKNEDYSPSLYEYSPKALIALNNFKTDGGVHGYYKDWKEFGLWMNTSLLTGRNVIDGATKTLHLIFNL